MAELLLNQNYKFEIKVLASNHLHYAGTLILTPEKISLRVSGELTAHDTLDIFNHYIPKLSCTNINENFILYDLYSYKYSSSLLDFQPERTFFHVEFEVKYLLYYESSYIDEDKYYGISIYSEDIKKWIGNTNKQEKIISEYYSNELLKTDSNILCELFTEINHNMILAFQYSLTTYHNSPSQTAGLRFPPYAYFTFEKYNSIENLKIIIEKFTDLFFILLGYKISYEKIIIKVDQLGSNNNIYYYFPTHTKLKVATENIVFFPLSTNLRFNQLNLPEMPMNIFSEFFNLNQYERKLFTKYITYKSFEFTEDKFLGFFRLVESLVYTKKSYFDDELLETALEAAKEKLKEKKAKSKDISSYIKLCKKINYSKLNTESNINNFLKKIPSDLKEKLKFDESTVTIMVKLRNDITHVNEYSVEDRKLVEYIYFLEFLIIILLLKKLNIDDCILLSIIPRFSKYRYLLK